MQNKVEYDIFFTELQAEVKKSDIKSKTPMKGLFTIGLIFILYIFGLLSIGNIPIVLSMLLFYVLITQLAFVSHDLSHAQYFRNKKIEQFFTYLMGSVLFGMGYHWWGDKHNIKHHGLTNSDLHDGDILEADHMFVRHKSKYPFLQKNKSILYWCMAPFMYIYLLSMSYKFSIQHKKYLDLFLSIIPTVVLPVLFISNFGFFTGIMSILIIYLAAGFHLAISFMVNHIGMEVLDGRKIKQYSWFDIQTRTSRNVSGGAIIYFIFGGLNKQIEHHLFPTISRFEYPKLAKIVRDFSEKREIIYHEVSLFQALKEIQTTLNKEVAD